MKPRSESQASRSQADPDDGQELTEDEILAEGRAALEEATKEFQVVLEREDKALRKQFAQKGFTPMQAQARALLWLINLQDVHLEVLKKAVEEDDTAAVAAWARDLGKLSAAIAVLETIQPIIP
ncbi:MAG: hypothetical protein F4Z75_03200 [Synechococcus sp. SB0668_bin_15]|nr:hypothetical protein [Synechococcus sp. SB0668_bin_15]MYA91558.1 hypothetical protein [Synechococcus sp. SB0663_bin_10]MYC48707.1 hypothetical protein [Synechococcus sp. SB0662_bin_14]MYG46748.1 hypothetical protein [Synechococcus sp. SB0675_bin_6]MYJ59605.1 hypothetical protein [Synechococcus sp. SB0672_bin_6]MYK90917.1 hypothetical protein [Synechococcus sp. SB0669_bin_8]